VTAVAILAPSATASTLTTQQLKTHLQGAKRHLRSARAQARRAAANAAGAGQLHALTVDATTSQPAAQPDPSATPTPQPSAAALATPPGMSQAVADQLLADGVVTDAEVAALGARAQLLKKITHRWAVRVRLLTRRLRRSRQIDRWARRGQWKPLIAIAGRTYGVNRASLYRMMMLESGGRRFAGSTFKGLFQYYPGTWSGSWNPWRHASIFNGWAQIRATAYAIRKGMGPSNWPNTYRMAF
jgi:hypothetical protein